MSKVLCTFSGKFGDILWSLPTAKALAARYGMAVDFGVMPQYGSLLELLEFQPYIERAFIIAGWECTGSPHGDQPWQPPKTCEQGYDHVHHLTYMQHPGMGCPAFPLCDFSAWQAGVTLIRPVVPFLEARGLEVHPPPAKPVLTYSFNGDFDQLKKDFLCRLILRTAGQLAWSDTNQRSWMDAASEIAHAGLHIGCRSAGWVLAMGLGVQTITFEPNPSRHASGPWGKVFGCPYGKETALSRTLSPQLLGEEAANIVMEWRDRYWNRAQENEEVRAI